MIHKCDFENYQIISTGNGGDDGGTTVVQDYKCEINHPCEHTTILSEINESKIENLCSDDFSCCTTVFIGKILLI